MQAVGQLNRPPDPQPETPTVRASLSARRKPFWMILVEGRALRYRRGPGGSSGLLEVRLIGLRTLIPTTAIDGAA
jgi:hypothetical protein